MAAIGNTNLTLIDLAKRMDPDGKAAAIAELLSAKNELLDDMLWSQGNLDTGDRYTIRTGIPSATWRRINQGTQPTKSTTAQIDLACGSLEARAQIDTKLLDIANDPGSLLMSESAAFIEGMSQQCASAMIYESQATNSERITGLAQYYSSVSTGTSLSATNVIDAGGSGSDNTSIYLVVWDANTICGIVPKNLSSGIRMKDLGEQRVLDASSNPYQARELLFQWDLGLKVKDWRYGVRICNIDISDLTFNAASGANLVDLMVRALERIDNLGAGKAAFYCNRTIREYLRRQLMNKSNVWLNRETIAGKPVLTFGDIPVRRVDALLNTEARVT